MKKKVVFAGSFNPFTIGHADIVSRALKIFDEVIIAIGVNEHKQSDSERENSANDIRLLYASDERVKVAIYHGLTADFAKSAGACCMIRGVRSAADYDYEKNLADINLEILGIDTLLMPCRPNLSHISSSAVRELKHNGYDINQFLPKE